MGRESKRVTAGFDWPLGQVWKGFLNPHYEGHCKDCEACAGSGYSPEAQRLLDAWHGNAPFSPASTGSVAFTPLHPIIRKMAERNVNETPDCYGSGDHAIYREANRLSVLFNQRWQHHLDEQDVAALAEADRLRNLTPREVNEWSICGFGHGAINSWICIKAKCDRLGYPHTCAQCHGDGSIWDSPSNKQRAEDWQDQEPPAGDWWQVWETVSEGSPVTPPFATAEELIDYLTRYGDRWDQQRGEDGWERDAATRFVQAGSAVSLLHVPTPEGGVLLEPRDGMPVSNP